MSTGQFSLQAIAASVPGLRIHRLDFPELHFSEFAFDTRRLPDAAGSLFVALSGEQRDGHAFVLDAYNKGVRHFLLSHAEVVPGPANVLLAENCTLALQSIAAWYRSTLHYPILAITGSNGKTVVKEWLASMLEPQFRLGKSPGSFNSQIGVPLSILDLQPGNDLGIIEAGISKPGEMATLASMIRPDLGILTHFGDAHAEGFVDADEKLEEKLRLFTGCETVFMGADNAAVLAKANHLAANIITVGRAEQANLRVLQVRNHATGGLEIDLLEKGSSPTTIEAPFEGGAALENILLLVLVARQLVVEHHAVAVPHQVGLSDAGTLVASVTRLFVQSFRATVCREVAFAELQVFTQQGAGAR